MFTRYKTEAIFLKKYQRFEADEYLIVYTEDFGKMGVTGKSIRKIKSKLKSGARLFCYSEIEFIRGRYYNILTDTDKVNGFSDIKKSLGKLSTSFKMASLFDSFLPEEEKDERLWLFLKKSFRILDEMELRLKNGEKSEDLRRFYYYFAFKFLELAGYKPEVNCCVVDKRSEVSAFSPREGGLLCKVCSKNIKDPLEVGIKPEDRDFLKAVSESDMENFLRRNLQFSNLGELLKNYTAVLPSKGMS